MLGDLPKGRGRPCGTAPALSSAPRMADLRARRREEGLVEVTVRLPLDVLSALDAFIQFRDMDKGAVIEKLVRIHIIRKR